MKYIELTHGLQAIVNDEDYERMNQWNWFVALSEDKQKGKQNSVKIFRDFHGKKIEFGEDLFAHDKSKQYLTFRNHNRLDFRRENILFVPIELAQHHKASNTSSNSKYKGVYYDKSKETYITAITVDGKTVRIGSSKNEEVAAILYNDYTKKRFGEYAFQNILGEDNRKPVFATMENLQPRSSKQSKKEYRGVCQRDNHFQTSIKGTTIGTYKTGQDAAYAYNQESIRLNGKNAILNPLPDGFIGNPPVNEEIELFGDTYSNLSDIAKKFGIPKTTLHNRMKKMSVEEAVRLGKAKPKLKLEGTSMRQLAETYDIDRKKLSSLIKEGKTVEEAIQFLQAKKKNREK